MKAFYESFPIELIEAPYKIVKKDGSQINGVHANFNFPKGFPLETVANAMVFAAFLGRSVNQRLNLALEKNKEESERIKKTMNWIDKKAKFHPWEMRHISDKISKMPEFLKELTVLGFSEKEIQKDIKLISILHDIGRLTEVDLKSVHKFDMSAVKGKGHDHAFESYEILLSVGFNRPEILLPVKYHGLLDFESNLKDDPMFEALSENEKKRVMSYTYAVRDADRTSNLLSYTIYGIKRCGEMSDPNYSPVLHPEKYYAVTPICVERLKRGECGRVSEAKTYLDTMLRFVSWSFQMHYTSVKKMVANDVTLKIWDRIFEQAEDEWNEAPVKNLKKYTDTLNQLREAKQIVMKKLDPAHEISVKTKPHTFGKRIFLNNQNIR